jgi:hypothetical protein
MARLSSALFVAAVMTPLAPAQAQSFTRGGRNCTTTTTDYNLGNQLVQPAHRRAAGRRHPIGDFRHDGIGLGRRH